MDKTDVTGGLRKLLQDLIVPELRELSARMKALEEITKTKLDAMEVTNKTRFDSIDFKLETIMGSFKFDERLKKVEAAHEQKAS